MKRMTPSPGQGAQPAQRGQQGQRRATLLRLVQVARRELTQLGRLDEGGYRATLERIAGKSSAAELDVSELTKVLDYFKSMGFKVRSKAGPTLEMPAPQPSRALALDAESRKVRALWLFLFQLGVVKDASEEALAAYVKRLAGVDALQWVDREQAERLIESLKKWAMRFLPKLVNELAGKAATLALHPDTAAELEARLARARGRRTYDPMYEAWSYLDAVLKAGATV